MQRRNVIAAAVSAAGSLLAQKSTIPKVQDRLALAQEDVEQLLLLMDTDKNGKISKKEFMRFMELEFDRLDKDRSGELDPRELTLFKLQARPFAKAGK